MQIFVNSRNAVVGAAVTALLIASGSAPAKSAQSTNVLEGYWTYGGSLVLVRTTGTGFEGLRLTPSVRGCPTPFGTVLFRVTGTGMRYTGQNLWHRTPGCELRYSSDAAVDLTSVDVGQLCATDPFGLSGRQCLPLARGCDTTMGAARGGPICVGSATKASARAAASRWLAAANSGASLLRRLRGSDRRTLRALGSSFSRYQQTQAGVFAIVAKDPPDMNYRQIAQPKAVKPSAARPSPRRTLVQNFAQANSVGRALVTAINRAAGARLADDAQALSAQNAAAIADAGKLIALLQRQPELARRVVAALKPPSATGRRLVGQLASAAFTARVRLSVDVLRAFVAQNA